ncbi:MAG: serine protease [Polaromonas sp.]|nr:serine protease [Polaromonas sp.]
MKTRKMFRSPVRALAAAVLTLTATLAHSASTWDPARPTEVKLDSLVFGDNRYTDVVVTVGDLLGFSQTGPSRTYNAFNPANGSLTIAHLSVGNQSFYDVVIRVGGLVSVGGGGPLTELTPTDPLFSAQWHLKNTGQSGAGGDPALVGEDLNVGKAWRLATGTAIQIAVVDDGLDIHHEDLRVVSGKSWDYRVNAYGDPSSSTSSHGTSCGGLAAAMGNNMGVTGVAFNARLVGYNLLAATTGGYGADAVTKDLPSNHIYTNSYGAADGTGVMFPEETAWSEAIATGVTQGRGGKGVVYTWAAGNGAPVDRSDYDGQGNHPMVLAIGSLNGQGKRSSYSEPGSNVLVTAYGGEFCATQTTTTTDVSGPGGYNDGNKPEDISGSPNYTRCMNGTSAATPQVAGLAALLLEVNPALTWRDVRKILATTARKNDPAHADWVTNGAGFRVNHDYGFGVVDALAAVRAAQSWTMLPAQKTAGAEAVLAAALPLADNGTAVTSTLSLQASGISQLEFVELRVTSDHTDVGNLEIVLTSPAGTPSTVSAVRGCVNAQQEPVTCGAGLSSGFRFGIARLMGEAADGTWTLSVRDGKTGDTGSLSAWSIRAHGY